MFLEREKGLVWGEWEDGACVERMGGGWGGGLGLCGR